MTASTRLIPALLTLAISTSATVSVRAENWPQWRGPSLDGTSRERNLPVTWSKTENIAWSLAVPSWSGSTPIVWGDRIFLNVAEGSELSLWCVDRARGMVRWKRPIGGGNRRMQKQNMSSPSPVTDGQHVWVMTGTGVLKAFDFEGKEAWMRDIQADYDFGEYTLSSPAISDGQIFIRTDAFLYAIGQRR